MKKNIKKQVTDWIWLYFIVAAAMVYMFIEMIKGIF